MKRPCESRIVEGVDFTEATCSRRKHHKGKHREVWHGVAPTAKDGIRTPEKMRPYTVVVEWE